MFEDFWKVYPRKVAKKAAQKAWVKMTFTEQTKALEAVTLHVEYWKSKDTEHEFIPHPATGLNQGRYEDELVIEAPKPKPVSRAPAPITPLDKPTKEALPLDDPNLSQDEFNRRMDAEEEKAFKARRY